MIWFLHTARPPQDLVKDLEATDPEMRRKAFNELIEHEDPTTDGLVLSTFQSIGDAPKELLLPLIEIIGHRGIEEGVELLKPLLAEEDPEVKITTLRALFKIPSQKSLDAILPLLADEDLTIRREIHQAVTNIFEENSMGALIRAIPQDKTSPLYFEIVSLFDDMDFFDKLKENFQHPDPEVKKFHFNSMIKFHRPEFIPLFLEMADLGGKAIQTKLRETLSDYSFDELIPPIKSVLKGTPSKNFINLIEDILFSSPGDSKEDLLSLVGGISQNELRVVLLEKLLTKIDPFLFIPALDFLDDPFPKVRSLIRDSLISLYKDTKARLTNPDEEKKSYLSDLMEQWSRKVLSLMNRETNEAGFGDLAKLFFAMAETDFNLFRPVISRLLLDQFPETLKAVCLWKPADRIRFFQEAISENPAIGNLLIIGMGKYPSPEILQVLLKIYANLPNQDKENLKKILTTTRTHFAKLMEFLDDSDPNVRVSTLDFLFEVGGENLPNIIEARIHDPSPQVRLKAIHLATKMRHQHVAKILTEACSDPISSVALQALKSLKQVLPGEQYTPILAKVINSPSEEIRNYALYEIAKTTQKKYIENFNTLSPEIRKLAGSAILKLDASFIDHLIKELKSLDPESRLRAAMIMENLHVGGKGKDALLSAMQDPSKKVRAAVVKTLGVFGDRALFGNLIEFLNDPDERVRANTIEAISSIGDARAVQILLPYLEDHNNRIRANAALAVWQIAKVNVLPVLIKMLSHRESLMKASALWVLGEIKQDTNLPMILPMLKDTDALVRLNTLKAIAKIKVDAIKPFLAALRKDPAPEVKKFLSEVSRKII